MLNNESQLNNSIIRYLKFAKNLEMDKIEMNGFPINLDKSNNSFDLVKNIFNETLSHLSDLISVLSEKFSDKTLIFYSLQNTFIVSPREYWNGITNKILEINYGKCENKKIEFKDKLFFFLYSFNGKDKKESEEFYKTMNSTDEQFCHSLLLRDLVRKRNLGIEIDLSNEMLKQKTDGKKEISDYLGEKLSKLIRKEDNCNDEKTNENNFSIPLNNLLESFNTYFKLDNCKSLKEECYLKYITDFYAFNLNCNAFKDVKELKINDVQLSNIKSGHDLYSSLLQAVVKDDSDKLKDVSKWLIYINILSDLTKLIVFFKPLNDCDKPKILLIDDRLDKIDNEINYLNYWLNDAIEIREYLKSTEDINNYFRKFDDEKIKEIKGYDFILMDLDIGGELKGFEYLKLLREKTELYEKPFVIVFSRNEEPESIQKALNMGALIYATKQNVAKLVLEIFKVLPLVNKINNINDALKNDSKEKVSLGDNWNLLYKLPLTKILELKTSKICGQNYNHYSSEGKEKGENDNYGFNDKALKNDEEYLWIKKLPKAELHNHIGSVLGPELIPKTALVVLSKWYEKNVIKIKIDSKDFIKKIINYLKPIVTDPYLWEAENAFRKFLNKRKYKGKNRDRIVNRDWYKLKYYFLTDENTQFYDQSIFTIIADSLNLKGMNKTPEEVLLSPQDQTIEKHFKPFSKIKNSSYLQQKIELRKLGVDYDIVMLFFILLLALRQNKAEDTKSYLQNISKQILDDLNKVNENGNGLVFIDEKEKNTFESGISSFIKKLLEEIKNQDVLFPIKESDKYLLKNLISAHSIQRCLKYEDRGLFNYLRGCEYGGAPHLQCKESIFLAANHIINNYAIPENIRYLDLRCAIDGYNKLKLFSEKDENVHNKIVKTLKQAFTYYQNKAIKEGSKVHINIIITAKRHKAEKEFEKNVQITLDNYPTHEIISSESDKKEKLFFSENNKTEVVSFDIAGLEKGFRLNRFKDQIKPLLDRCIPITMHAGEEDSHEAIWEAIYLGHAQRLGHALSLEENENLLKLVRETFVNVELCPISNYLTNNKFPFDGNGIIEKYPLKKYLEKRLSISINTDNPYVSDTTLTKEFLFASKICGGLTKWEILKIILYSFKSITIEKQLKSKLMKEIDEEIFEFLLNES